MNKDQIKNSAVEFMALENKSAMEVTWREGEAPVIYDPTPLREEPFHLGSIVEFLRKRGAQIPEEERDASLVLYGISRSEFWIALNLSYRDHFSDRLTESLEVNSELKEIGLPDGKVSFAPSELADIFRMRRYWFSDKQENMKLVTQLRSFKAKVDRQIEAVKDERGNRKALLEQAVDSNLPESFHLFMPLFEGKEPQRFLVEVYIDPSDLSCRLLSPDLMDAIQEQGEKLVMEQIEIIENEWPKISILRQ